MEIHDTTIFNEVLEALDTGKTIYVLDSYEYDSIAPPMYVTVTGFCCYIASEAPPIITLYFTLYDSTLAIDIEPSINYSNNDLYVPTNIAISEYQPQM